MSGKFFSVFEGDGPGPLTEQNDRWYSVGRGWFMPLISIHDTTPAPKDRTKWYIAATIFLLSAIAVFAVCVALRDLKVR